MDLLGPIKIAVEKELRRAGEQPGDYNMDAIVNPTAIQHGEIIRDYRMMITTGRRKADIYRELSRIHKPYPPETIKKIVIRHFAR